MKRKREGFVIYPSLKMNGTPPEEAASSYAKSLGWELIELLDWREIGKGYTQIAARVRKGVSDG